MRGFLTCSRIIYSWLNIFTCKLVRVSKSKTWPLWDSQTKLLRKFFYNICWFIASFLECWVWTVVAARLIQFPAISPDRWCGGAATVTPSNRRTVGFADIEAYICRFLSTVLCNSRMQINQDILTSIRKNLCKMIKLHIRDSLPILPRTTWVNPANSHFGCTSRSEIVRGLSSEPRRFKLIRDMDRPKWVGIGIYLSTTTTGLRLIIKFKTS